MKLIRQNLELIIVVVVALIVAFFTKFVFNLNGITINFYDRFADLVVGLLGFMIAAYAIFISFIKNLKEKVGDKDVLSSLNLYFILGIFLLFITDIIYVVYPLFSTPDTFWFRAVYLITIGTSILIIYYLYLSAKKFIA